MLNVVSVEVKRLKQLVRDVIDPTRNLGHVDSHDNEARQSQIIANTTSRKTTDDGNKAAPIRATPSHMMPGVKIDKSEDSVPTDPGAAAATGPPDEKGKRGIGKGVAEGCEDCI